MRNDLQFSFNPRRALTRFFVLTIGSCLLFSPVLASSYTIGEPLTIWNKKDLSVCWASRSNWKDSEVDRYESFSDEDILTFDLEQKHLIQQIISENYTPSKTGIQFIGWKDCSETPNSDVYIIRIEIESKFGGLASIGNKGELIYENLNEEEFVEKYVSSGSASKAFVVLNTIKKDQKVEPGQRLQILALHEFGHVTGLRHEHARADSKSDPNCKIPEIDFYSEESEASTTKRFGPYDFNSIMNYCYLYGIYFYTGLTFNQTRTPFYLEDPTLFQVNGDMTTISITLSSKDKSTLKKMYP